MKKIILLTLSALALLLIITPVINAEEGEGLKPVKVLNSPAKTPTGLVWDGKYFWVLDRKTAMIIQMDPKDGSVIKKIAAPAYWPSGLAWDGSQLWLSDLERRMIYRIDPKTEIITHAFDSPVGRPYGLAWDGKLLWVLESSGELSSIDPDDGTTIVGHKTPATAGTGLTFDGTYLWSSDRIKDEIYMICPKTGSVINVLHAPGKFAYGLAWDGKYLWNVDYQSDKLYALDVRGSGKLYTYNERIADVTLTAVINNLESGTIETLDYYVAVPVERNGQKLLSKIEWTPEPEGYLTDKWGQKVAHFKLKDLKPAEKREILMKVRVSASAVRYLLYPDKISNDIPEDIKKQYLIDDVKYDITNSYIQGLVKKIVGDEKNIYWKARKIYDYLIANMYYEMVGGWNTAPTVLKRGNGSCSEYSFSFISLCRAAGVPARYVGTVVVRGDDASWDQAFHRWNEVYLPGYGWIDVDANRGDKDLPADQGRAFGGISNHFLVTTTSGGGSEYLDFNYNYNLHYTAKGKVNLRVDIYAEWEPVENK